MSTDYSYDENGHFFPFFILTITGIVTFPLTYSLLKPSSAPADTAPRIQTDFVPDHADLITVQRKKQKRRERRLKRIITVIGGWALMALMVYLICYIVPEVKQKLYNPYDILGLAETSSEVEIKRHYKRMSLKYHPDKVRPDPAKNQTVESLNQAFIEITQAYKTLTDEDIRNNYLLYGHPDGKQSMSIGIALPQFIITDGNGKYVLFLYAGFLGILLPLLVGQWWYGTLGRTKEGVLVESANNLFREYEENITDGGIIGALSCGSEFKQVLKGDKAESGLTILESKIFAEDGPLSGMTSKDKRKLQDLDDGARRKVLGLLWAYLGRIDLQDQALDEAKYEVAPIAHLLNDSFNTITLAFQVTAPILGSYHTSQNLIQAMPPDASPLLQLPYMTPSIAKHIENDKKTHLSLQQYMSLPESVRRAKTVGPKLLTQAQYNTAMAVAAQIPLLQVEKAYFKVTGERHITPGSLVSLVVKGRFVPPGARGVPDVVPSDLEDIDPAEDDLDAIMGRAKKVVVNGKEVKEAQKPIAPPLAHAPYYPRDYSPKWHVFLSDSKQGKMAVPPFTFTLFEKPLFTKDSTGSKLVPTFNMQTLKANFQAPPQAGQYTFVMHIICDSYVGLDTKMEVTLDVEDPSKTDAVAQEDEISEPDEDSLAGQMQALKTGQAPAKSKKKAKPVDSSEEEEESNTEGEEEDGDSDATNTDTEVEDNDKK